MFNVGDVVTHAASGKTSKVIEARPGRPGAHSSYLVDFGDGKSFVTDADLVIPPAPPSAELAALRSELAETKDALAAADAANKSLSDELAVTQKELKESRTPLAGINNPHQPFQLAK
jgi:hypothetical protein